MHRFIRIDKAWSWRVFSNHFSRAQEQELWIYRCWRKFKRLSREIGTSNWIFSTLWLERRGRFVGTWKYFPGSEKRGNFPRFYPRPPRIFAFLYPVCISNRRTIEIQIFFHVILKRFLFKSCTKSEYVVKLSSQAKIRERIRNKKNNRFLSFLLGAGISGIRESKDLCHEIGDDKRGKFRPL